MRTLSTLFSALSLLAVPAAAQAQSGLSLDDARRRAHEHSFRLQAAGHAVAAAAGGVRMAKAELLPALSAVATGVDYDGDVFYARFINPLAPGTPNPDAEPTDVGSFSSTRAGVLKLSQPLYAGGALRSGVRARRLEQRIAEAELDQQRLDLDFEVTRAYFDALLAERSIEVAGDSLRRSQENLEIVQRRRAEQEALRVEELAAETQQARDRHRLDSAKGGLRLAHLALQRLLASSAGDDVVLSDPLERPPRPLDEAAAVRRALDHHPALARGELRLDLAAEAIKAARAHFKPKLELEGYHAWIDSETFFEGTTFGVDLKVSIPFFRDAAAGGGAGARAAAARELEASHHREAASQIELLARRAVHRLEDAYGAVEVAGRALEAQREKYRVTASAFGEQLATAGDLLAEHAALAEAQLQLHAAHHEARIAEAELDRVAPAGG